MKSTDAIEVEEGVGALRLQHTIIVELDLNVSSRTNFTAVTLFNGPVSGSICIATNLATAVEDNPGETEAAARQGVFLEVDRLDVAVDGEVSADLSDGRQRGQVGDEDGARGWRTSGIIIVLLGRRRRRLKL